MTRHSILGAGKTPDWAGATPLLTAFTRPKFCGVAPARHHRTVTVFARVHTEMYSTLNPETKRTRLQKGEDRSANLESTAQTTQNHSRTVTAR
jgi:hypothetical protein